MITWLKHGTSVACFGALQIRFIINIKKLFIFIIIIIIISSSSSSSSRSTTTPIGSIVTTITSGSIVTTITGGGIVTTITSGGIVTTITIIFNYFLHLPGLKFLRMPLTQSCT